MNLEEIRYDILDEIEYQRDFYYKQMKDDTLPKHRRDVAAGRVFAYIEMFHYILRYGEDSYDYELENCSIQSTAFNAWFNYDLLYWNVS